ncbi:hypothetical protein B0H13DRAFT_1853659 [Mycena leptocephala]|nr:hypothetical protein B0H13DRAFT_1853659 [Mycena leptocephala]
MLAENSHRLHVKKNIQESPQSSMKRFELGTGPTGSTADRDEDDDDEVTPIVAVDPAPASAVANPDPPKFGKCCKTLSPTLGSTVAVRELPPLNFQLGHLAKEGDARPRSGRPAAYKTDWLAYTRKIIAKIENRSKKNRLFSLLSGALGLAGRGGWEPEHRRTKGCDGRNGLKFCPGGPHTRAADGAAHRHLIDDVNGGSETSTTQGMRRAVRVGRRLFKDFLAPPGCFKMLVGYTLGQGVVKITLTQPMPTLFRILCTKNIFERTKEVQRARKKASTRERKPAHAKERWRAKESRLIFSARTSAEGSILNCQPNCKFPQGSLQVINSSDIRTFLAQASKAYLRSSASLKLRGQGLSSRQHLADKRTTGRHQGFNLITI